MSNKIVITGGSGFIGHPLISKLQKEGYQLLVLSRQPGQHDELNSASVKMMYWDARNINGWIKELESAAAVINLAGENLSSGLWTEKRKQKLVQSRLDATGAIVEAIKISTNHPNVLIQASGINYYGASRDEKLDETSEKGEGFLADLCDRWESTAAEVEEQGVRLVRMRFGLVLGKDGGLLSRMTLPYRFFAGFHFGNNKQWMSWVHRRDVVNSILFAIRNPKITGAVNVSAPQPVLFREFLGQLGKELNRPSWLFIPPSLMKILLGEMARETLFSSLQVMPEKLTNSGYSFTFDNIEGALQDILKGLGRS
jgi:uncharacterized protein (TIGR01777 family)